MNQTLNKTYKKNNDYYNEIIIQQLPKAIAIFDKNMYYIEVSEKWLSDYNLKRSQTIGKSHYEVFPEIGDVWKADHQKCLKGGIVKSDEDYFERADGRIQWLKYEVKPWYDNSGEIGGLIMYSEDITEQKNREIQLKESKNLLLEATKVSKVGAWEYHVSENKLEWSLITKQIHEVADNYSPNVSTGLDFYLEGRDRELITAAFNKVFKKGKPYNLELRIKTQKGNIKWVRAIGKANFKQGECIRVYGTFQDINNEKLLEEKIINSEEKFRNAFNYSAIGMAIVSLEGRWIETNNRVSEILGYSHNELKELTFQDITHPDDLTIDLKHLDELINGRRKYYHMEKRYFHKNGRIIWVRLGVSMVADEKGAPVHFISQIKDITELKKNEEEVKNLFNITSKQNERLLNFAHIVSHNLRSHSTNISALLKLYSEEKDNTLREEMFNLINNASQNLNSTISNLNEVVAINENINNDKVKLNLLEEVEKVLLNVKALVKEKDATIKINILKSIYLKSIPAYIESIMLNLITNGIKYSSKKRKPIITVSAKQHHDYLEIEVQDNGVGIDLKKHEQKLFGMYKTFHGNEDARGIGLFITKNQIDALGGEISVASEIDKGTTFKIKFYEKN